jgi:tetratricopeptide (TPR) repeat protein
MLTREETVLQEQAEQALAAGRPADALASYRRLLHNVRVLGGVFEKWVAGMLSACRALGKRQMAGILLLAQRRFDEALACFDPATDPYEWALCAEALGRYAEASAAFRAADLPVLAAMALEKAQDASGAAVKWQVVLGHERLRGHAYQTALVHFNLARVWRQMGATAQARQETAITQRLLEACADDFETQGESERALDCYGAWLRLGRDSGSFEDVAEGTLNSIRILAASQQRFLVLQYYDDFLQLASTVGEWHAAASLAVEAADFSASLGPPYQRHYQQRALSLWHEAARQNLLAKGPVEVSENAFVAGVDVAASLGDLHMIGRLYTALAELDLAEAKRARYAAWATRYREAAPNLSVEAPPMEHWRRQDAYPEVWLQDLVEWELTGHPAWTLERLVVAPLALVSSSRAALCALLVVIDKDGSPDDASCAAELALALGEVMVYDVIQPIEELARHTAALVRAAATAAAGRTPHRRSFGIIRRSLADQDGTVRREAVQALRSLSYCDAFASLARFFRESVDPEARLAALDAIGKIDTLEAGLFLVDVVRQDGGEAGQRALAFLRGRPGLANMVRHAMAMETGAVKKALESLLQE